MRRGTLLRRPAGSGQLREDGVEAEQDRDEEHQQRQHGDDRDLSTRANNPQHTRRRYGQ